MSLLKSLFPRMLRSTLTMDERINQVQLQSYRLGFRIMEYGLLLSAAYLGFVLGNPISWGLFAIWLIARLTMFIHQYQKDAIHVQALRDSLISFVVLFFIVLFFASFLLILK